MKKTTFISILIALKITFLINLTQAASLSPTIYYIKTINLSQDCESKKNIYSVEGKVLAKVCKEAYKKCVIEGTCALTKGDPVIPEGSSSATPEIKLINYIKMGSDARPLFGNVDVQRCPWGYGVKSICLDPYYTVAADLSYHKAGDVIFVDKLKGVKLPNGEIHAGFLIVRDKGGAIKGAHRFDFYTGFLPYKDERNPFTLQGFNSKISRFEYRKASKEEAQHFQQERNFPGVPQ